MSLNTLLIVHPEILGADWSPGPHMGCLFTSSQHPGFGVLWEALGMWCMAVPSFFLFLLSDFAPLLKAMSFPPLGGSALSWVSGGIYLTVSLSVAHLPNDLYWSPHYAQCRQSPLQVVFPLALPLWSELPS